MINYTEKTIHEQFDIIANFADNFSINNEKLSDFIEEENNAIIIPTSYINKTKFNDTLLICFELAKILTLNTDCIFYVCIECPNDIYNECIVINSIYNFNNYC